MRKGEVGTKIARVLPVRAVRVPEQTTVTADVHAEFTGRTGTQTRIP